MSSTELELVEDRELIIKAAIEDGGMMAIKKIALDIEGEAKKMATAHDAIDTGALKASIHAEFSGHSGHAAAKSAAQGAASQPGKHSGKPNKAVLAGAFFPQNGVSGPEAIVAVGVEYGAMVEYGTVHTGARPFFGPAVDKIAAGIPDVFAAEINRKL